MKLIVTLSLNSSVDVQWEVDEMVPVRKLRSSAPLQFPGAGGVNVSRVIKTLGGQSIAIHTAGWFTGHFFREMVEAQGLLTRTIPIAGATRTSATIYERSSGQEFRITPPGPTLTEQEWRNCLSALSDYPTDYVVLTGSLPLGVPQDFYARAARLAKASNVRVVLDTSGQALFEALKEGAYLVKPNQHELEHLVGRKLPDPEDQETVCRQMVDDGKAEIVVLTLGDEGALMISKDERVRLKAPKVEVKSAVGAGDSFIAGITFGLAQGFAPREAFALGLATGTASVLTAGTELCRREDVERLYREICGDPLLLDRSN
jgi:6-phosphofructokinase 2